MTTDEKDQLIEELRSQIQNLEDRIRSLSIDPAYEVTTRPAIEFELRPVSHLAKSLVFLDIDYLHSLNRELPGGEEEANQRIRRALNIRSEDVLVKARWYSGDELIIILSGDPVSFCSRLLEAFARESMSFTYSFVDYSGDILGDASKAKERVKQLKGERGERQ